MKSIFFYLILKANYSCALNFLIINNSILKQKNQKNKFKKIMKIILFAIIAFSCVKAQDYDQKFIDCLEKNICSMSPKCDQNDQECQKENQRIEICSKSCIRSINSYKDIADCIQSKCKSKVTTEQLVDLRVKCLQEAFTRDETDQTTNKPSDPQNPSKPLNPSDNIKQSQNSSSKFITLAMYLLHIALFIMF
ncbi:transmembrane protein, putative (macronuclear) [Tetrahymena thermophila SB210]|uniref:Transmembrane protein, putative n=1 Tax=Tetrahymena thermophila (strain SB210) TaxID=312017 RepID=I7MK70_TETTS|nr:transmembrane protein, putative [Tetrahymena thermophila SB210]EAS07906.2 transmembrane protein, putative [Tetrahymena thermophila SB210]|eukprot:XP_001028148.2 transmembrane protein, putative [Tetrahymena thermophila SB210]